MLKTCRRPLRLSVWKVVCMIREADREPQHTAHLPKHGNGRTKCSVTLSFTSAWVAPRLGPGSSLAPLIKHCLTCSCSYYHAPPEGACLLRIKPAAGSLSGMLPRKRRHVTPLQESKQKCLLSALCAAWTVGYNREAFLSSVPPL